MGDENSSPVNSMQRFDPQANVWTDLPVAPNLRIELASAVIAGQLHISGGILYGDANPHDPLDGTGGVEHYSSSQRYDPRTSTWQSLPSMNVCAGRCSGINIGGMFYVVGGTNHIEIDGVV